MARLTREDYSNTIWYNVKRGSLVCHKTGEVLAGLRGYLQGIRTKKNDTYGHLELHIKLHDPEDEEGGSYIIAGSLTNPDRSVQIWARMFLAAMANPANEIGPDDQIVIEFWAFETDFGDASCCSVRLSTDPTKFERLSIDKEDTKAIADCLNMLSDRYPWSNGLNTLPAGSNPEKLPESTTDAEEPSKQPDEEGTRQAGAKPTKKRRPDVELPDYAKALYGEPPPSDEDKVSSVAGNEDDDDDDDGLPF